MRQPGGPRITCQRPQRRYSSSLEMAPPRFRDPVRRLSYSADCLSWLNSKLGLCHVSKRQPVVGGWSLSLVRGRSCSLQAQRPQAPGEVARPVGQASSAPVQEILPSMLAQVVILAVVPQATTKPN
jgi:hypothetical protein